MHVTTLQERVAIAILVDAGHSDRDIARHLGYRPATIRKWRRRVQREGRQGLATQMGRPATGCMAGFPLAVGEALRTRRQSHPRWGPKTLLAELGIDQSLTGQPLPSRPTIARWLKEQGLVRAYERHRELPQPKPTLARSPHEEWELDLATFGMNLGMAFQLVDDVLDYAAAEEELGKSIGKDLQEGKVTLPIIRTLEQCTDTEKERLVNSIRSRSLEPHQLHQILETVRYYDGLDYTHAKARGFLEDAKGRLRDLPDGQDKAALMAVADFVASRRN